VQPAAATVCLEPAAQGGHEKEADMQRTQLITTAALVAACAVPASAVAQGQDLRSPDTRDAAAEAAAAADYQDLRSPDTRDAARSSGPRQYSDLRSPDARDAGRAQPPVTIPVVDAPDGTGGFDWGDASIGAAGMLALMGIAVGSILAVSQSRRRRRAHALAH
jgi:hypothetical protein